MRQEGANKYIIMISEKQYLDAKQIIQLYEKQKRNEEHLKLLPNLQFDLILEYQDLTGNWYEYSKILQNNIHFIPEKLRVVRSKFI